MLAAQLARVLKGTVSPKPASHGNVCGSPAQCLVLCFSAGRTPLSPAQASGSAGRVGAGGSRKNGCRDPAGWAGALLQGPTQISAS